MDQVDPKLLEVMKTSMANIRAYHEMQIRRSWFDSKPDGTLLGQKITALERVGRLCSRRKGGLSFLRPYEHHSGQSSRSG